MDKSILQEIMNEFHHIINGCILLEKIYDEIGPYRQGNISEKTWNEVLNYYKFDDSE